MAKGSRNSSDATTPKRTRKSQPKYFRVTLNGVEQPKIVVSMTKKAAVEAVMSITEANHEDLMAAGKQDWDIIDLTKPKDQLSIVRSVAPLPAAEVGGAAA